MVLAAGKGIIDGEKLPESLEPLGLCCLSDVLRDNVTETLNYFRRQGVTLKVISGDDPRTVANIARRVGMPGWENFVDATTLTDDAALAEAAERCTIFGRVTPEQKRKLVEALKAAGHSVAMTGDGVNDIPALKAADCSIAMAGGADAAKHAAQLTLMNADFAAMPEIVGEGRRVINNITRAASLFLVKTLYSFMLSVLMLVLPLTYPFQPIQLTLVSSLTVGIPSFFLALEPNQERVRGELPADGFEPGASGRDRRNGLLLAGDGLRRGLRSAHGHGQHAGDAGHGYGGVNGAFPRVFAPKPQPHRALFRDAPQHGRCCAFRQQSLLPCASSRAAHRHSPFPRAFHPSLPPHVPHHPH